MRKARKHFTPEEKVAILRRHLVDKVAVSELCEELGLRPTVFYMPSATVSWKPPDTTSESPPASCVKSEVASRRDVG